MVPTGDWLQSLWVILMAAMPVVELRGAIPLALTLGFTPGSALLLAVLGNLLPVAPLLLLLQPVRKFLEQNLSLFQRFFAWLDARTYKRSTQVEKYGMLGLVLLTAVPLPTTGAWTASLAAVLFKISFWPALIAISTGVVMAGILVTLLISGVI